MWLTGISKKGLYAPAYFLLENHPFLQYRQEIFEQSQQADVEGRWLFSCLSADKKKTYCLSEASSAEALCEHTRRLNIPAEAIIEGGGALATDGDVRLRTG